MIYFDNSATTQTDKDVAQLAYETMVTNFGNPSSLHFLGAESYKQLGIARNQIAKMLGAHTEKIYFTSGATESNNIAIHGGAIACKWGGKHIVTTSIEHDSVLKTVSFLEDSGWDVTKINPDNFSHHIQAKDIIDAVRPDTAIVSVMYVNNETGEILPLKEIIKGVREKNPHTLIHCDCVQGFGKIPFKLHDFDVDMLSASGHKLHAPKGIGMLYLKNKDTVCPLEYGGSQEAKINPGTESVPLACAFGLATDKALYGIHDNYNYVSGLREYLLQQLQKLVPDIIINSPKNCSPYIVNFSIPWIASSKLISFMSLHDVFLSSSSACTKNTPSHVLQAMQCNCEIVNGALRIGLCKYNTIQEIDKFICLLKEFLSL